MSVWQWVLVFAVVSFVGGCVLGRYLKFWGADFEHVAEWHCQHCGAPVTFEASHACPVQLKPHPYDLAGIARRNFGAEVRNIRRGELAALQALAQDEAMGGE